MANSFGIKVMLALYDKFGDTYDRVTGWAVVVDRSRKRAFYHPFYGGDTPSPEDREMLTRCFGDTAEIVAVFPKHKRKAAVKESLRRYAEFQ